jgi:hypothetical protein
LLVTALGVLALYGGNLLVGVIRCGLFVLDSRLNWTQSKLDI